MAPKKKEKPKSGRKEKQSRSVYRGPTSAIVDALRPEIKETGFIKYHETPNGTRLNKSLIQSQGCFIRCLHQVTPNLSFTQRQMEEALGCIAHEKHWFLNQRSVKAEWQEIQAKRLRCIARHFTQAASKARGAGTSWVHLVLQVRPFQTHCL